LNQDQHNEEETLIAKYLAGETSSAEEQRLHEWVAESKENEAQLGRARQAFALTKMHYAPDAHQQLNIDVDLEWQRFISRIETSKGDQKTFIFNFPLSNQWLKVAASIVLVVVSGFVANYLLTRPVDTIYQTAENTEMFSLPDGSVVTLNRYSKLTFAEDFGKNIREVTLEGEGFFEVVPDTANPFVVQVDKTLVRVLGTSFSVQGYLTRPSLEVTVATGRVAVATKDINQEVQLETGERAIYSRNSRELKKQVNEDANFLSWKTKQLIFNAANLQEVVAAVGFTYGVEIVVSTAIPDSCKVTVSFDNQSLDAILNVLKSTLDLTYRTIGKKIEIVEAGC